MKSGLASLHPSCYCKIKGYLNTNFLKEETGEETGKVEIEFQNMIFSGQSEKTKFPAICEGNYSIINDSINFENTCFWTAEFDWTLILGGKWKYEVSKDHLILRKTNVDRYILARK